MLWHAGKKRIRNEAQAISNNAELINCYENLRKLALGEMEVEHSNKYGISLLIHKGLPTWIKTWVSCLAKDNEIEEQKNNFPAKQGGERLEKMNVHAEMVSIIANIIVNHHKGDKE